MANYYSLLTDVGLAKVTNSYVQGKKVELKTLVVGDGGGTYYQPTSGMTELKNQVWTGNVTQYAVSDSDPRLCGVGGLLPTDVGGFAIREFGVKDADGDLIAVSNYPDTVKIARTDGVSTEIRLVLEIMLTNAATAVFKVDPTIIMATKQDIENIQKAIDDFKKLAVTGGKLGSTPLTVTANTLIIPAADSTHDGYMAKEQAEKLAGIENNANNYTHPTTAGSKHIPAGGTAGQALMWQADGTAKWQQVHYTFTAALPVSGWSSTASYTQTISVYGITADMDPYLYLVPATVGSPTEAEEEAFACITGGTTAAGSVTFNCREDKPTTNITVRLEAII